VSHVETFHQAARQVLLFSLSLLLSACANLSYYAQSMDGQFELMERRQPIDKVMADPATPASLRDHLQLTQDARNFASRVLLLPDNGSYRSYADLGRPFAVWLVVATPPLSVTPRRWCFVFAGCVSYRGYFSEADAQAFAQKLAEANDDVYISGGIAYSTLGWFDDPVLNTMLNRSDSAIAGLLFHELAHQKLYVKDDTAFNEAFAVTIEREGMRRWMELRNDATGFENYLADRQRQDAFYALLAAYRERLAAVYASTLSEQQKLDCKRQLFAELRGAYQSFKAAHDNYAGFDKWMARDLNNAHLALVATYQDLVPGFQHLLATLGGDLTAFYREAERIGKLPEAERETRLLPETLSSGKRTSTAGLSACRGVAAQGFIRYDSTRLSATQKPKSCAH
jgi:predicted aminopeptidase